MFSVFAHYPTFLVFLAIVIAAALTMAFMPLWIRMLRSSHIGQQVRADGPQSHLVKQGTPTMGGVIMLVAVILTALVVGHPTPETFALLIATVLTGCLGLIDDAEKVVKERSLGLTPKAKLVGQFLISTVFGLVAVNVMGIAPTIEIPFIYTFDLGVLTTHFGAVEVPWLYIIFVDILLMGMCNAVNLTDGLDGLAILPSVMVGGALGIFAYVVGRPDYAGYLIFPYIPGAGELVVIAGALLGAGLAFLWYNAHPAQVFMGDVGALALGGCLGTMAVITRQELVLAVMGGIFVVETLSVMIQTVYFRLSHGKRIFLMAPIHHHFELKGWKETQVVTRFWIITMILVLIGLSTLKIR